MHACACACACACLCLCRCRCQCQCELTLALGPMPRDRSLCQECQVACVAICLSRSTCSRGRLCGGPGAPCGKEKKRGSGAITWQSRCRSSWARRTLARRRSCRPSHGSASDNKQTTHNLGRLSSGAGRAGAGPACPEVHRSGWALHTAHALCSAMPPRVLAARQREA